MQLELQIDDDPSSEVRQSILSALSEYNAQAGPQTLARPLAIVIRDLAGTTIGGMWGQSLYDWLNIELLVVPEAMRGTGVGSRLLAQAEAQARERGCIGVWLDTFSFQAKGFYERLGYAAVGTIEDHPVGGARYIMSKRLADQPEN
jgi:GNAT superfamily N-acetyltransferase